MYDKIIYDKNPYVMYRQHSQALIGGNRSFLSYLKKFSILIQGHFRIWNDKNCKALEKNINFLNESSKNTLEIFYKIRNSNLFLRLFYLLKSRIFRQTILGNLTLVIATILKRM